jgi:hypothetical protein
MSNLTVTGSGPKRVNLPDEVIQHLDLWIRDEKGRALVIVVGSNRSVEERNRVAEICRAALEATL